MLKLSSLKPSKYTRWIFASIGRFVTGITSVELIQVVLKNIKKQEAKMREEEVAAKTKNIQVTILQ